LTMEKGEDDRWINTGTAWFDDAAATAQKWVADAMECLKGTVKSVLKIGFRVVAGVLEFAVETFGKLLKFVIKGVGQLLRTLVNFLKDTLGIDLTGLLEWLGYIFDVDNIKTTQKVAMLTRQPPIRTTTDVKHRFLWAYSTTVLR